MKTRQKTVLFLCTSNSCRSQMAEAVVNTQFGEEWQACSAGVRPSGQVHPLAVKALQEIGIQHEGYSKTPEVFHGIQFDLVVTVCDPARDNCPVWLRGGKVIHYPLVDPAQAEGSEEERMQVFRRVRDQIAREISGILSA